MVLLRCAPTFVVLAVGFAVTANAQTEKTSPTDTEINLVLTQTEPAMQQYKPLIDQEEVQTGKNGADTIVRDRQVVSGLEMAIKAFRVKPQGFNGPLGFAFFQWLDDASRNAALCAGGSSNQAMAQMLAGNADKADVLLHLGQGCADVSTLIYTVSENAGALYQRYVESEQELAEQAANVAQRCTDILKRNGVPPQK
jgi:hypothetical protein